ncbi:MAG: phage tail assembly chaperone [Candidatus Fimivivens sp.]
MSFKAFLRSAAKMPENVKAVISKRFIDESTGEPIPWELRAITEDEHAAIKDACTSKNLFKGRMSSSFNTTRYNRMLAAASVVYPDLKDAELQKDYGVIGADELLGKMLLPGEMIALQQLVTEINGFDLEKISAEMDTVKNS